MIQRIQSIYLFIASVFLFIPTLLPISQLYEPSNQTMITMYALKIVSLEKTTTSLGIISTGILLYLSIILGFTTIFLFKNRKVQLLLTSVIMILTFAICNLIVANTYLLLPSPQAIMSFKYVSVLPVVALILFFLAYKAIKKDDKLVKSLDRIR